MTTSERVMADPEPTPPGEWSCPICGQSFKSDCTYPVGRAPICGRDAVPMVPVNRAPDTANTEPTPDRAVMTNIDLVNEFSTAAHRRFDLSDRNRARRYQDLYSAARAELLRRLAAATERPAEAVTISRDDVEQALDAMGYVQERLDYFWDKWSYQSTYDRMHAALSAASDGGDCG